MAEYTGQRRSDGGLFGVATVVTALAGNRGEDFAGADLQVLLGQSDAASFLLQPMLVCREAVSLKGQVFPDRGSGWATEDGALLDETPRREVGAKPLDLDAELAADNEQRRGIDHGGGDPTRLQTFLPGPASRQRRDLPCRGGIERLLGHEEIGQITGGDEGLTGVAGQPRSVDLDRSSY